MKTIARNYRSWIALFIAISIFAPFAYSSDRFSFAQTYLGYGLHRIPSGTSQVLNGGIFEDYDIPARTNQRILIGGLHFWNHVDFEISLLLNGEAESGGTESFVNHVSTAGFATHIYPLALTPNKIRPFIGIGINGEVRYEQGQDLSDASAVTFKDHPLRIGLAYRTEHHMFELGAQKLDRNRFDYYVSREEKTEVKLNETSFWLNYKYVMETTKNAKEGTIKDAVTIGVGPSSGRYFEEIPFNGNQRPFLGSNVLNAGLFPEFSLGYYHFDWDLQFNLAYRNYTGEDSGFGLKQEFTRSATAFEVYKFLFDWNGFVPFLGPHINYDKLTLQEIDSGIETFKHTDNLVNYGLTFGWDIKPVRKMKWILRTTLRYTFNSDAMFEGTEQEFKSDAWEFNWIQAVFLF